MIIFHLNVMTFFWGALYFIMEAYKKLIREPFVCQADIYIEY